jgi:hypothetical protein
MVNTTYALIGYWEGDRYRSAAICYIVAAASLIGAIAQAPNGG